MAARIDTSLVTILVFMRRSKRANQPFEELILQLSEQPHLVLCGCIRSGDFWEWKKSLAWKYAAWNSCVFSWMCFNFSPGLFFLFGWKSVKSRTNVWRAWPRVARAKANVKIRAGERMLTKFIAPTNAEGTVYVSRDHISELAIFEESLLFTHRVERVSPVRRTESSWLAPINTWKLGEPYAHEGSPTFVGFFFFFWCFCSGF